MIAFVEGTLEAVDPLGAVINANGVGYALRIPLNTAASLPAVGSTVRLHTAHVVREDAEELYGFHRMEDRDTFRRITQRVSGVGPRLAIAILSHFDTPALQQLVDAGDAVGLAKCPGIGKKTAERIIVDLRGAFPTAASTAGASTAPSAPGTGPSSETEDAVMALVALGYREADARKAVERAAKASKEPLTLDALIRAALK